MKLTEREKGMVLRAMEFIECGEWPWKASCDGTSPAEESRDRAAWKRAKEKLER